MNEGVLVAVRVCVRVGVTVGVLIWVAVTVPDGVLLGVRVRVVVGETVGVVVDVVVGVMVAVLVAVCVTLGVFVEVAVPVALGVFVAVIGGVNVGVSVCVLVAVLLAVGVDVAVGVEVGVSDGVSVGVSSGATPPFTGAPVAVTLNGIGGSSLSARITFANDRKAGSAVFAMTLMSAIVPSPVGGAGAPEVPYATVTKPVTLSIVSVPIALLPVEVKNHGGSGHVIVPRMTAQKGFPPSGAKGGIPALRNASLGLKTLRIVGSKRTSN